MNTGPKSGGEADVKTDPETDPESGPASGPETDPGAGPETGWGGGLRIGRDSAPVSGPGSGPEAGFGATPGVGPGDDPETGRDAGLRVGRDGASVSGWRRGSDAGPDAGRGRGVSLGPGSVGAPPPRRWRQRLRRLDRLTLVLGAPLLLALLLPAFSLRANRIAPPQPRGLVQSLGLPLALLTAAAAVLLVLALLRWREPARRLALLGLALTGLLLLLGRGATALVQAAGPGARISPAAGLWLALAALVLLVADALARLQAGPALRAALLAGAVAALALLLASGLFADLSIAAELRGRGGAFRQASRDHLVLAFGSFAAALLAGLPAGIALHRRQRLRRPVLDGLTLIQTIPSIALFGMLILPLAWVAAHVPLAARAGVAGIGMAPALVALFLYSLLPIVANTLAGLDGVPPAVEEAARGMGMTSGQRLRQVELPLALPVILAGARIVLVQNIGLAAVGALIGSGGYGVFIFQGIGQTAADLILLGVLPIVALAFLTSATLDLLISLQARAA